MTTQCDLSFHSIWIALSSFYFYLLLNKNKKYVKGKTCVIIVHTGWLILLGFDKRFIGYHKQMRVFNMFTKLSVVSVYKYLRLDKIAIIKLGKHVICIETCIIGSKCFYSICKMWKIILN